MSGEKEQLNELHFNLLGKITLAAIGAWLVGKATNVKLRGSPKQIEAVSAAMIASRRFQDELKRPGASVESVMEKLRVKNMSAAEFERTFGFRWPV